MGRSIPPASTRATVLRRRGSTASSMVAPAHVAPTAQPGRAGPGRRDGTAPLVVEKDRGRRSSAVRQGPAIAGRPTTIPEYVHAAQYLCGAYAAGPGHPWTSGRQG